MPPSFKDAGDYDVVAPLAPGEEAPAPMKIRGARIRVVDRDGEEFEKAARGSVAGGRDGRRHDRSARPPCFIKRHKTTTIPFFGSSLFSVG